MSSYFLLFDITGDGRKGRLFVVPTGQDKTADGTLRHGPGPAPSHAATGDLGQQEEDLVHKQVQT